MLSARFLLLCGSLLVAPLLTGCYARHIVRPIDNPGHEAERGFYYALPYTVIRVEIPTRRETRIPSAFVRALDDTQKTRALADVQTWLGIELRIAAGDPSFAIDGAQLSTRAEADPDAAYYVEVAGGWLKDVDFGLTRSEEGVVATADSSVDNKAFAFGVSTVKVAAGIAGAVLRGGVSPVQADPGVASRQGDLYKTPWGMIILRVLLIREQRNNLLGGKVPPGLSVDLLDRILRELDAQEAALLQNFDEVEQIETARLAVEVRAAQECIGRPLQLLSVSRKGGVKAASAEQDCGLKTSPVSPPPPKAGGAPSASAPKDPERAFVRITHAALPPGFAAPELVTSGDTLTTLTLRFDWDPPRSQQLAEKLTTPATGERSYYYRVPAMVRAEVAQEVAKDGVSNKPAYGALARERLAVAHFGRIVSLPAHLSSLNSRIKLTFTPASGAITDLSVTSKAISLETPAQLGEAASSIVEGLEARRRAKAEQQDELNRLKREGDLLEQRKRVRELEIQLMKLQ